MSGKQILVSGLAGSGKSTLARAAAKKVPNLHYIQTVTTRLRRPDELDAVEYDFVTPAEYTRRRTLSKNWDHNDIHGNWYGADVDEIISKLKSGISMICTCAPDKETLAFRAIQFHTKPVTIWLEVPDAVRLPRIADDSKRAQRIEDESVKYDCDYIFTPSGSLDIDESKFVEFIEDILANT